MLKEVLSQIVEVVDTHIRPTLQADGGDIEIIEFRDNVLFVRLHGTCLHCPHAKLTLENAVENTIRRMVSKSIAIKAL